MSSPNGEARIIASMGVPLSREKKGEGSSQVPFFARRTRTMKLCSSDARSGSPNRPPACEREGKLTRKDHIEGEGCSMCRIGQPWLLPLGRSGTKERVLLVEPRRGDFFYLRDDLG